MTAVQNLLFPCLREELPLLEEREVLNKEAGQLGRQASNDSSIFNDALVSFCYTTLVLPHFHFLL